MAPRSDSSVLTTFNQNGWGSNGLATLVGLSAPVVATIGPVCRSSLPFISAIFRCSMLTIGAQDCQVHLSEEMRDASKYLPMSMVATAVTNYVLGFTTIVTLAFCSGDPAKALASPTGQPYVEILFNATQSTKATMALASIIFILLVACTVNNVTSSSRQLWSFARDRGLPFSDFLSHVRPGWDVPMNAMGQCYSQQAQRRRFGLSIIRI